MVSYLFEDKCVLRVIKHLYPPDLYTSCYASRTRIKMRKVLKRLRTSKEHMMSVAGVAFVVMNGNWNKIKKI